MSDSEGGAVACRMCGKVFGDSDPWVSLNRYVVGTGTKAFMVEQEDEDGECVWDMGSPGVDDYVWVGLKLCWPGCLFPWIESEMLEGSVASPDEDSEQHP